MPSKLSRTATTNGADLVTLWKTDQGDYRGISNTDYIAFLKENFGSVTYVTQSAVITSSGFNVNVTDNGGNIWLIIRPIAAVEAGAITLPAAASAVDGQEVQVFCTRQVTTFTVNGNGAAEVLGDPTSLAAESFFNMRFDSLTLSWIRVA